MKYGIDEFISESKSAFDKLTVKATEAVNVSKAYVEKAQLRVKIKEKYLELGKTCYTMHKDGSDETGIMKKIIKELKMLEAELEFAEDASGKPKICGICGTKNNSDNCFCTKCGEKL